MDAFSAIKKEYKMIIRYALPADILQVASIYRDLFATSFRSQLGQENCEKFLNTVLKNQCHQLLVAFYRTEIIGLTVLNFDVEMQISKDWFYKYLLALIRLVVRSPSFFCMRLGINLYRPVKGILAKDISNSIFEIGL